MLYFTSLINLLLDLQVLALGLAQLCRFGRYVLVYLDSLELA